MLDRSALERLRRWGGSKLLRDMIRIFFEQGPLRLEAALEGVRNGNLTAVGSATHALKSSAAYVGAQRVQRLAGTIEDQADAGDLKNVTALLEALAAELAAAIAQLADECGEDDA